MKIVGCALTARGVNKIIMSFTNRHSRGLKGAGVMGSFTAAPSRFPGRRSPQMLVIGFIRHS